MNLIKNIFAVVGFCVSVLYIAGAFGIGNFAIVYGPTKVICK